MQIEVRVCGKKKSQITVAEDADYKTIESAARTDDKIVEAIKGKTVCKVIIARDGNTTEWVNIVAK